MAATGKLYLESCFFFFFFFNEGWRKIESDFGIDMLALLAAIFCIFINIAAWRELSAQNPQNALRCLLAAAACYSISVGISIGITHTTNTRNPKNEYEQMIYLEAGWSLVSAVLSILLMICAAYSAHVQHKRIVQRRESERRRRQLHNAIMSSCRQDIAMAIRARMTVI